MIPNLIAVYRVLPKELFRVNNGLNVRLRNKARARAAPSQRLVYDIASRDGRVLPKAMDAASYRDPVPNGASMRPNTLYQQQLVRSIFHGHSRIVYAVPAETQLPEDLVIVHERTDHYSLQPAKEKLLEELNIRITAFLSEFGRLYTRDEWMSAYPKATEFIEYGKPR